MDRVLVFDIWGDHAHFRRAETTTSPLTYPIPTGTALVGIISAIIGLERDSYYELFSPENARFAIRILRPIKKIRINLNLIDTSRGYRLCDVKENPRSRIPFEFLKQPKYRIYFWTKHDELHQKLKQRLEGHQSFYTPFLGISELIANFKYINEFAVEGPKRAKKNEEINSVVRRDKAKLIVEKEKRYRTDRIPVYMDENRVVREYADVFLEVNGKALKISDGKFYTVGDENVIFI